MMPQQVRIVEVGPRDGLQNEKRVLPTADKVALIQRLVAAGLRTVEATAFVSPKWVPQMADYDEVLRMTLAQTAADSGASYPVLTPNLRGLEAALAAGATEVAIFGAASESFSRKNINCSIAESLQRFSAVVQAARQAGVRVRAYVSCVAGCPYEGPVAPAKVADVVARMRDLGCYEISLGDTIGTGTPRSIDAMLEAVLREVPAQQLAGHYHDTFGMAIVNIYASLQRGLAVFDASVGGLGGCPYARGASGNVATEDVVWLLQGLGIDCGVNLTQLTDIALWISSEFGRAPASRVSRALSARQCQAVDTAGNECR